MELNINENLKFSASTPDEGIDFTHSEFIERVGTGFNEHGIRENRNESGELESVDVIFQAMEPGPPENRNGVRITSDFLERVSSKDYSDNPPHLKDHDDQDTFARIGDVQDAWFSDRLDKLMLMTRTPNIDGSTNHQEAIARYTHDPPAIRDGSLGFGQNYTAIRNDDGEPEMKDGKFREFSTTNFPGGYDEGGVNTAFSEAVADAFNGDGDGEDSDLDEVYSEWSSKVNMTASQLEQWADHPCANEASQDPDKVRDRNLRLLEKNKSDWTSEDISDAERTISFISRMRGQRPDSPAEGGKGTCPSEWAISLLNWAYNPFDEMPDGDPNPDAEENSINKTTLTFSGHMEEKSKVYEQYEALVNMDEQDMEMWEMHPCSDKGVDGGEDHRDNFYMLSGQPMEEWGMEEMQIANRAIDFMVSETEKDPENPEEGGPGTCPSRWAVNLLNRGHNPFDSFPSGNPQFSTETETITKFDDSEDGEKPGENLATDGFAVQTDTIQF